jgi:hypothetical protein
MANDLYVYFKYSNADNIYCDIMTEMRARLAELLNAEEGAAREIARAQKGAQKESREIKPIVKFLINEDLDEVSPVPDSPNALYVRFTFADSFSEAKKILPTLSGVAYVSPGKKSAVRQEFRDGFVEGKRVFFEGKKTQPCRHKKTLVCRGDCAVCV